MWWILGAIVVTGGIMAGPIASDVEQASYTVLQKSGAVELRRYAPTLVAETTVAGEQGKAINEGFKRIADYIFGNNTSSSAIAMTAPVLQQPSEKIPMTAPVLQAPSGKGWQVQFVMPASYTLATLPKPNNPEVRLRKVGAHPVAAITFSGMADEEALREQTEALRAYLAEHHLRSAGAPVYAFYNPPWTLPFLRRNEVLIPITQHH